METHWFVRTRTGNGSQMESSVTLVVTVLGSHAVGRTFQEWCRFAMPTILSVWMSGVRMSGSVTAQTENSVMMATYSTLEMETLMNQESMEMLKLMELTKLLCILSGTR